MELRKSIVLLVSSISFAAYGQIAAGDETGVGNDTDIPDATPPGPTETNATNDAWQALLEWFNPDNNDESM